MTNSVEQIQQTFDEIKETLFPRLGKGWNLVISDDIIGKYFTEEEKYFNYRYLDGEQPLGYCDVHKKNIILHTENFEITKNRLRRIIIHEFCHIGNDEGHNDAFYQRMASKRRQLIKLGGQTSLTNDLRTEIKDHHQKEASDKQNIYERKVSAYVSDVLDNVLDSKVQTIKNAMKDIPRNYYKKVFNEVYNEIHGFN